MRLKVPRLVKPTPTQVAVRRLAEDGAEDADEVRLVPGFLLTVQR
jgi:hypothetical protein